MSNFVDILQERRSELSAIPWAFRTLNTLKPYSTKFSDTTRFHQEDVLHSNKIQDIIQHMQAKTTLKASDIIGEVRKILLEIGYNKSTNTIRLIGIALANVCSKICKGLFVNQERVNAFIRTTSTGSAPVIYLPSHRSYADFILMSYVLFTFNIDIPAIAAGMDFHGMKGMGTVLRNTGAFFMRRSYNNDDLYWDIFRQYVGQIISNGKIGLEFFIEGTRSRSCKSLQPKFGLLTIILKAFLTREVPDLLLVPINISYDRIMEENLFACELLGIPKPKESTSGFLKSLRIISENYGNIYVDFGEPISVAKYFKQTLFDDSALQMTKPLHLQEFGSQHRPLISTLAEKITVCQQKLSVVSSFNIIAVVLMDILVARNEKSVLMKDLTENVAWVAVLLKEFGANSNYCKDDEILKQALSTHANLVEVGDNNAVRLRASNADFSTLDSRKLKGHHLRTITMKNALPVITLQIYVNPIMHYITDAAFIIYLLGNKAMAQDDLYIVFERARKMFANDFVLVRTDTRENFIVAFKLLARLNVIHANECKPIRLNREHNKLIKLLTNLLEPFLFSYYTFCVCLLELGSLENSDKIIFSNYQAKIESKIISDSVHAYCLNLDSATHCRTMLVEEGALQKITKNMTTHYTTNTDKVAEVIEFLLAGILKVPQCLEYIDNKSCFDYFEQIFHNSTTEESTTVPRIPMFLRKPVCRTCVRYN